VWEGVHADPFHYIYHHVYKVAVYATAERADTLPLFLLCPYMYSVVRTYHGRMNYKDTKPYMSAFCKIDLLTDVAALYLTDLIDWRYIHSCLVFTTLLVNCCPHGQRNYTCVLLPLYLLSDLPPLSPFPNKMYSLYRECGCGGGGGVLNRAVDHILQEFYTLFLARIRTYKIASPPQTK
jgi:hypothetical protein